MKNDKPEKKRDIWFVMNALAAALLVMAVLHTIEPYIQPPDPLKPKIMEYAATIEVVKPDHMPALLASANGKPTLLVVYASWCPTCRWKTPDVVALLQEGRLDHVNTVFLSFDKGPMKLATYLVHNNFYRDIHPYIYQNFFADADLLNILKNRGSRFQGGIPFMEVYSPAGRARTFIPHMASKAQILAATKIQ